MAKLLDVIIIIDVEATCWEGKQPHDQDSEIIEIGICLMDIQSREILENETIIVKPENSEISSFCKTLTSLTQEDVDKGITFKEACSILKNKYFSHKRIWASYGAYDLNQFRKQCDKQNVEFPFSSSHINIKSLFSIKARIMREVGMKGALESLNLPLIGTHHRGVDDARNIAFILKELL